MKMKIHANGTTVECGQRRTVPAEDVCIAVRVRHIDGREETVVKRLDDLITTEGLIRAKGHAMCNVQSILLGTGEGTVALVQPDWEFLDIGVEFDASFPHERTGA